jgi:hypothetical protein
MDLQKKISKIVDNPHATIQYSLNTLKTFDYDLFMDNITIALCNENYYTDNYGDEYFKAVGIFDNDIVVSVEKNNYDNQIIVIIQLMYDEFNVSNDAVAYARIVIREFIMTQIKE